MTDNLITSENISIELIKKIYEDAYFDVVVDNEEGVCVKDQCNVSILINDCKTVIQLITFFSFKDESDGLSRCKAVNNLNEKYVMIKAISGSNNRLVFRYDFVLDGGITKKSLVLGLKRFASIPCDAIEDYAKDLVD